MSGSNVRGRHTFKKQIIASSHRRWQLLSRSSRAGQVTPFASTLSIRFPSEYPHSVLEPLGRTIPSPSEQNATAKQGSEGRPPIAGNLPSCACTLTHAFANSPIRTQRTSLKHGAGSLHSVACPVGGLHHRERQRKYRLHASKRGRRCGVDIANGGSFAYVERLRRRQKFAHPAQQRPSSLAAAVIKARAL